AATTQLSPRSRRTPKLRKSRTLSVLSVVRFYFPTNPSFYFPTSRNSITYFAIITRHRPILQHRLNIQIQQSHNQTASLHCRAIHLHIQRGREMKPRLVHMFTITKKLVVDQPATLPFVERNRSPVYNRISMMFAHNLVEIIARLPLKHA